MQVLGPLLFFVYINDLPSRVCSTVRMFADDCLLYHTIKTVHDTNTLQCDLDSLQEGVKDWLMEFNPSKYEAITFTVYKENYTSKGKVQPPQHDPRD